MENLNYYFKEDKFANKEDEQQIQDVLDNIKDIEYGFISKKDGCRITDRDWIHKCNNLYDYYNVCNDPEKTINDKLGICQDQSIAIKYLMNKLHPDYPCTIYALMKGRFGHAVPTIKINNKYYYLENAWDKEKGLHGPFYSESELENYLSYIYHKNHDADNDDDVVVQKYDVYLKNNDALNESAGIMSKDFLSEHTKTEENKKEILNESRLPKDGRDPQFGVPQQEKYPLWDEKHVRSAIKLFGHVEPKFEKQLARAIIAKMKKYGIPFSEVGEENKLYKYIPKKFITESLFKKKKDPDEEEFTIKTGMDIEKDIVPKLGRWSIQYYKLDNDGRYERYGIRSRYVEYLWRKYGVRVITRPDETRVLKAEYLGTDEMEDED